MNRIAGRCAANPSDRSSSTLHLAAFAFGLLAFGSCQNGPDDGPAVDSRQFQDVAVPDGFRLRDRHHESWSREDASFRRGHFVYVGPASIEAAATYGLQRMPHHSWQLLEDGEATEAGKSMRFERGIYSAVYQFTHGEGVTQMVVDYDTDYTRR